MYPVTGGAQFWSCCQGRNLGSPCTLTAPRVMCLEIRRSVFSKLSPVSFPLKHGRRLNMLTPHVLLPPLSPVSLLQNTPQLLPSKRSQHARVVDQARRVLRRAR